MKPGESIGEYLTRNRDAHKRVQAIPYREETVDPFLARDLWLDQPEAMRRDPRRY